MFVMTRVYQAHCCLIIQKLLLCDTKTRSSAADSYLCDKVKANNGCWRLSFVPSCHLSPSVRICYIQSRYLQSWHLQSNGVVLTVITPTVTQRRINSYYTYSHTASPLQSFYQQSSPWPLQLYNLQSRSVAFTVVSSTITSRRFNSHDTYSHMTSLPQ